MNKDIGDQISTNINAEVFLKGTKGILQKSDDCGIRNSGKTLFDKHISQPRFYKTEWNASHNLIHQFLPNCDTKYIAVCSRVIYKNKG